MRAYLPIAAALAAFSFAASAADARPAAASPAICDRRDALVEYLAANHGERRAAAGIDGAGLLVEVFVGDGGSWSILLTRPNGMSCMVAAGQGWEFFRLAPGRDA
jgi:hypothetical protein